MINLITPQTLLVVAGLVLACIAFFALRAKSPATVSDKQIARTLAASRQLRHEGAWNQPKTK